jgi:hypothetical protein
MLALETANLTAQLSGEFNLGRGADRGGRFGDDFGGQQGGRDGRFRGPQGGGLPGDNSGTPTTPDTEAPTATPEANT